MAHFDATRPVVANKTFGARFQTLISRVLAALIEWNEHRLTRNELARLSDHQLDDLGLTRGDIETLFRR